MIDLSYLTEEEQEMIVTVLKRDAELKKAEEDRVKQLQKIPAEGGKLKYLSGEWFYEAKSQRHLDRIHGSDIIRASMNQKDQMTLLSLTQSWAARTRALSNGNKEKLRPPERLGENQEPPKQPKKDRESDHASRDLKQERPRVALRSSTKRHNPFNRASLVLSETPGETASQLTSGAAELHETTAGESFSPLKSDVSGPTDDLSLKGPGEIQEIDTEHAPVPKKRTILFKPLDSLLDNDSLFPKWGDWRIGSRSKSVPPRGILKHSTSWSSNDSGLPNEGAGRRLELPGDQPSLPADVAPEGKPTEKGAEDKNLDGTLYGEQAGFVPRDAAGGPNLWEGREYGDQDLVSLDHPAPLDEERGEVEPGTNCKKNDGSSGLSLAPCSTVCDQPPEEEGCPSDASRTLKESKFGWMTHTKFPPRDRTPSPGFEAQRHGRAGGREEAGTGEPLATGEMAPTRWEDVHLPHDPVGQNKTQAESTPPQVSCLPSFMDEKSKPVYARMRSHEASPVLELQSPEFAKGDSITKVLEWFSRSSDSQEEHVCEQEVETKDQPGAPEDDMTKHKMVEDRDQPVMPKGDFTTVNQALISDGSPTADIQVSHLRRAQLERNAMVEETGIICVEYSDKNQSLTEQERTCPESAIEDPILLQQTQFANSSLNTELAYQPVPRMSTVRPQSQNKVNAIETKEVHDREAKAILRSPVHKTTQQEVKQSEPRNERSPQRITNLKSFWESNNSSPKIPTSRSSATSKHKEIEPVSQTDRTKIESKVDLCKAEQKVPPRAGETYLDTKNEKEVYGMCVSHSLAQGIHTKGKSIDKEDGVCEPRVQSVLSLTQEDPLKRAQNDHREPEVVLAPRCVDEVLPLESSHLVESLEEEKYIAKCIVIGEDMEIPVSSVEGKTVLQKLPQKGEVPSGMAPLSKHVSSLVEQSSSATTVKQGPNQLDNSADKVRHLKTFWESEKPGPTVITDKPKQEIADTKKSQFSAPPASLNKKTSKSAFDLRMVDTDDDYSASPLKEGPNFTVTSMKQKMEKTSMGQSLSNLQFKNLRDFWGGTNGQTSQLPPTEKITLSPKSPQMKGQESSLNDLEESLSPTGDKKPYPRLPSKDLEMANFTAQRAENYNLKKYTIDISSPKGELKEKKRLSPPPLPRQESGSSDEMSMTRSSDSSPSMETKRTQSQQWPAGKEEQDSSFHSDQAPLIKHRTSIAQRNPQQPRKTSLGDTTGMVNLSEEQQDISSEHLRNTQEEQLSERQPPHREAPERRPSGTSNGGERPQPLARSCIPYQDYHHYLGIPEGETFQSMPAAKKEKEAETSASSPPEVELSVGSGPVRSSTPVVSEEPQARRGSEGQYPWQSHHGTDGLDLDSYRSSTCETWSYSGTSSACDDEDSNSVRMALERARLRPVSASKSVEDMTLLPTSEEEGRSKNTSRGELMLSMDDVSVIHQSPPSDLSQMKSMSKSVPAFLQKEVSGSVMSVYSGDFGSVEVRGTIQFSIGYLKKLKEFHILVVQCRDLAAVDPEKNRSNPYVKSYLLPNQPKLGKRKTSVKKKTLNPNFSEILRYRVRMETLKNLMLNLSVWHNDTFGRNIFLGEVEMDLSKWDFGKTHMDVLTLKPRVPSAFQASEYRGELRLALRFLPEMAYGNKSSNTGEVHIWVKDCKDLPIIRGISINPFVKCFVLPDTSRKSCQKTRVLKKTRSPSFNHTMVYDGFKAGDLPEACVELTVWDYDHIASHIVGGLRLGLGTGKSYGAVVGWMDSSADEANLWERMMDSPNEWVEDVLPLRMLTVAKNMGK
ncbi:uncharacterized protein sytl2b isoform X2 [Anguilla anguilla]|uniref:uncharacterized protein sytl2b isoform X2 n=1 Tax=Anguilla anguilla TaxID=7936 RepID=UPI0015A8414C|nr:uncharacterized protein sytl2b isoform X2 [Anguilla anguilla]